jgi:hypothetical protein
MRRKAFIVRVWQDAQGNIHGHITEPRLDWRRSFTSIEELWQTFVARMNTPSPEGQPVVADADHKAKES